MQAEKGFLEKIDYQTLVHSVTDYVVAVNRNFQVIMANDLFQKQFGLPPQAMCYEVWKKKDKKCTDCLVQKSFEDGKAHWKEDTVVMKEGKTARMLIKSTPVKNDRGEIVYVIETATDVTAKGSLKRELDRVAGKLEGMVAERIRDLQKSETRYRTIFERSQDAILLTDAQGKIREINQAGIDILGYNSKEELLALRSSLDLFESRSNRRRFSKRLFRDGLVTDFETRLTGKREQGVHVLLTCNVILDVSGKIAGYVILIKDISRLKKAQEEIEARNVRLATLNTISMKVSSSLDLDKVLESTINKLLEILEPAGIRIYLLDEKRAVLQLVAHKGFSAQFIRNGHMQSRKLGDGLLGQTAVTGQTKVVDNFLRSGDPYMESIIAEGLQSTVYIPLMSKGQPVGVMCVSSHTAYELSADYVEFLNAVGYQIGMAVDNANMYQNLKRAYGELKEAQEQVIRTEKLASLGKLAATIAHEINNPIAAVLTYIKLMIKMVGRQRFTAERMADISRYLETIQSETARCGEIVKNLLAFSRQSKITIASHSIEEIIDRTLTLIDHDLDMKEITLVRDLDPDLPSIRCDARQIQQALLNIMSNASEAMSKGGRLNLAAGRAKRGNYLEVLISDTGQGIAHEDLRNIFEPFFTTKEEGKGVGLGLSVAYGIITKHNGSIEVDSRPEQGSTFKVRLPFENSRPPADKAEVKSRSIQNSGEEYE